MPKEVPVYLRIRPALPHEEEYKNKRSSLTRIGNDKVQIYPDEATNFPFAQVFGPEASQEDVYSKVAYQAVSEVFDGYHGLIFSYGQTGTGKTFTMSCAEEGKEGILARSLGHIFDHITNDASNDYECRMMMVQIYREDIRDLLSPSEVKCDAYEDPVTKVVGLRNCTQHVVASKATGIELFKQGMEARTTAKTQMNEGSSRSHAVMILDVTREPKLDDENDGATQQGATKLMGRLTLVDLAGSERAKKSGAADDAELLREAASINKSLTTLGRVVEALASAKAGRVPYRDSKLTHLLHYSLSGRGKTTIIINVGPAIKDADETKAAILFGQRARQLKESAEKHQEQDYKRLYLALKAQVDHWQASGMLPTDLRDIDVTNGDRTAQRVEAVPDFQGKAELVAITNQMADRLKQKKEELKEVKRELNVVKGDRENDRAQIERLVVACKSYEKYADTAKEQQKAAENNLSLATNAQKKMRARNEELEKRLRDLQAQVPPMSPM